MVGPKVRLFSPSGYRGVKGRANSKDDAKKSPYPWRPKRVDRLPDIPGLLEPITRWSKTTGAGSTGSMRLMIRNLKSSIKMSLVLNQM